MKRKQRTFPAIRYTQITAPFSPGTLGHSSASQGLWETWRRFPGVFHLRSSTAEDLVLSAQQLQLPDSLPRIGLRSEQLGHRSDNMRAAVTCVIWQWPPRACLPWRFFHWIIITPLELQEWENFAHVEQGSFRYRTLSVLISVCLCCQ